MGFPTLWGKGVLVSLEVVGARGGLGGHCGADLAVALHNVEQLAQLMHPLVLPHLAAGLQTTLDLFHSGEMRFACLGLESYPWLEGKGGGRRGLQ